MQLNGNSAPLNASFFTQAIVNYNATVFGALVIGARLFGLAFVIRPPVTEHVFNY